MKLSCLLVALLVLLAALGSSTLSGAQAASEPRTVVIHAGHLLDVKTGKTLANQTIVIEGEKIASVKAMSGDELLPTGATVIDLPNATVLPGLIDAHVHLTM